jgi:uncharacterized membrane protein
MGGMTANHRTGRSIRLIFFAAGVVFSLLLLSEASTSYIPGPGVERQRLITELVLGTLALLSFTASRIPNRFSLRATLITMTVVAVVLGLISYAARK